MTAENTPKSGAGALAAGGTALALVLVAMGWWLTRDGGDAAEQSSPSSPAPQSAQDAGTATQTPVDQSDGAKDAGDTNSPSFDVVRVEPDGSAVIAGQAAPGSQVQLMVGDVLIGTAESDGNGNFVALLDLPPSDEPRVMSLVVNGETVQASDQSVIIGPVVGLVDATEADPAAAVAVEDQEHVEDTTAEPSAQMAGASEVAEADAGLAEKAPQVLLADQDGIKVLQDAGGQQGDVQVNLDSVSYDASGDVVISGRGTAQSALRVYLNNDLLAEAQVGDDGQWRLALPEVAPGIHTLRVDEVGPAGQVLSRMETPFKREDPAQLAAQLAGTSGETVQDQSLATDPAASTGAEDAAGAVGNIELGASSADANTSDGLAFASTAQSAASGDEAPKVAADEATPSGASDIAAPPSEPAPPRPSIITVQPGATLWAIARDSLGKGAMYVQVFDANRDKIRNPDLIYPGQVFTVPSGN